MKEANKSELACCESLLVYLAHSAFCSTYHFDKAPEITCIFFLTRSFSRRPRTTGVTLKLPPANDDVSIKAPPHYKSPQEPPTPAAGHVKTSGAIYNILIVFYDGISGGFFGGFLRFSLPSRFFAHCCHGAWINDITGKGVCVCMRVSVCVCAWDESWSLQTEWTWPEHIGWRAEALASKLWCCALNT